MTKASEKEIMDWMLECVANLLTMDKGEIDTSKRLSFYGLNSKNAVLFTQQLSEYLDYQFDVTIVWDHPTIDDIVSHIVNSAKNENKSKLPKHIENYNIHEPIAVIGVGCKFPNAANHQSFWELLKEQKTGISKVPEDKWNSSMYYHEDFGQPGKMNTEWGGFLEGIYDFDPLFFGISPKEAPHMDPQQRLMLEVVWQALDDAEIDYTKLRGTKTGIFNGAVWNDYALMSNKLGDASIGKYTATGNHHSIISNRISYLLGLRGPSMTIDTACSSSLVAVHLAVQSLRLGESELALAGGVNLILTPESTLAMSKLGAMAPDGQSKAFDASANGYVRGEGAGVVVLKTLSKAIKDGDFIYSVILNSATNNDGYSNGLTAPSPMAQEEVLKSAYHNSGVLPEQVQYVETHGTGTRLGDPIEAKALGSVLGKNRDANEQLILGSVKSQIGHLEGAAGIAGLIKVVLAIKNREIPANLNFNEPNPSIPFENYKLKVANKTMAWPTDKKALAGVTSIGFGGTNCHVVLQEFSLANRQLLICGGGTTEELETNLVKIGDACKEFENKVSAEEFCCAVNASYTPDAFGLGILYDNHKELQKKIEDYASGKDDPEILIGNTRAENKPIIFVCSGQGSQWLGIARQLVVREKTFRKVLDRCDQELKLYADISIIEFLTTDSEEHNLAKAEIVQPVFVAVQIALAALWKSWGITPDLVVGHSLGELASAYIGGYLSLSDTIKVAYYRGFQYSKVIEKGIGLTALVSLEVKEIQKYLKPFKGKIEIVAYNSTKSNVIAGEIEAMKQLLDTLTEDEVYNKTLNIGNMAAHSFQMKSIAGDFYSSIEDITPLLGNVEMISTVHRQKLSSQNYNESYWIKNITQPVRFNQVINDLIHLDPIFIEISPHPILRESIIGIGKENEKELLVANSLEKGFDDRESLLRNLGKIAMNSGVVNWPQVTSFKKTIDPDLRARFNAKELEEDTVFPMILPISAHTETALKQYAKEVLRKLSKEEGAYIDYAHALTKRRTHFDFRAAFVLGDATQRKELLFNVENDQHNPSVVFQSTRVKNKQVVFVFSGQGSQYLNMGKELFTSYEVFRNKINECERILKVGMQIEWNLRDLICQTLDNKELLKNTEVVQLLIFSTQVALVALWKSWGIEPKAVVGHSLGEIAAVHVSGAMNLKDALLLVTSRGRLMQKIKGKGCMISVFQSHEKMESFLKEVALDKHVDIAVINSQESVVVAADEKDRISLERYLNKYEYKYKVVSDQYAFHSRQLEFIQDTLPPLINSISYSKPTIDIYSSSTGKLLEYFDLAPDFWVRNCLQKVNFEAALNTIIDAGFRVLLEIGPNPDLFVHISKSFEDAGEEYQLLSSLKKGNQETFSMLKNAAKFYTLDYDLKWKNILKDNGNRCALPDYPYQKETFILDFKGSDSKRSSISVALNKPLLGQEVSLAFSDKVLFQFSVSASSFNYLKSFSFQDVVIYPFSCLVEMTLECARSYGKDSGSFHIYNLDLNNQVLLSNEQDNILQLVANPKEENTYECSIYDLESNTNSATPITTAEITIGNKPPILESEVFESVKARLPQQKISQLNMEQLYVSWGINNSVDYLAFDDEEILAKIKVELAENAVVDDAHYCIHPLLLESIVMLINGINSLEYRYPKSIQEIQYILPLVSEGWVHITYENEDRSILSVQFFNMNEECCLKVHGIHVSRLEELPTSCLKNIVDRNVLDPYFFRSDWNAELGIDNHEDQDVEGQLWMVFSDDSGLCKSVISDLEKKGAKCIIVVKGKNIDHLSENTYTINYEQDACFHEFFRINGFSNDLDGIIYAANSMDDKSLDLIHKDPALISQRLSCTRVFDLVNAYGKFDDAKNCSFIILTQGLFDQPTSFSTVVDSPILAMSKVIGQENIFKECKHVDVPSKITSKDHDQLMAELIQNAHDESSVVIDGEDYLTQELVKWDLPISTNQTLDPEKVYFVTGGTGELGYEVVTGLMEMGAKHLLLFTRNTNSSKVWSPLEIQFNSTIELVVANITLKDEVKPFFTKYKGKIGGIVHAAGNMKPCPLLQSKKSDYEEQLEPKVKAASVFHDLSYEEPLDFFISFSSAAAILGGKELGAYASANTFLDALMNYRNRCGLKGLSINWGPIAATNMAGKIPEDSMEKYGVKLLEKPLFKKLFKYVLFRPEAQLIIMNFDLSNSYVKSRQSGTNQEDLIHKRLLSEEALASLTKTELKDKIDLILEKLFEKVLGIKSLHPNKNFFDVGMDSLMIMELRASIRKYFKVSVSMTQFYAKPTMEDLADELHRRMMLLRAKKRKKDELVK